MVPKTATDGMSKSGGRKLRMAALKQRNSRAAAITAFGLAAWRQGNPSSHGGTGLG